MKPPKQAGDGDTVSSGSELKFSDLQAAINYMPQTKSDNVVLVAPNKKVAELWRKEYPRIEVILRKDYKGYDLPNTNRERIV